MHAEPGAVAPSHPPGRGPGRPPGEARLPGLPLDDVEALAHLHHGGDALALARRAVTPAVLRSLAGSPYPFVRQAVAVNPATPTDALAALAGRRDSDWNDNDLLHLLARHPATAGSALDRVVDAVAGLLAEGRRPYAAVLALAARPDADPARLAALGRLPGASARLRTGLARALADRDRAGGTGVGREPAVVPVPGSSVSEQAGEVGAQVGDLGEVTDVGDGQDGDAVGVLLLGGGHGVRGDGGRGGATAQGGRQEDDADEGAADGVAHGGLRG
ncbi:hypothetical protein GCM10018781_03690 [Kitasatospora indigofera]|uniref:Leucine rich repeat variant n=1 Tax=Kitasatospora indigofera TaxID=67307 RepID=A0A919FBA0_9ACTN|nr:hypothetical protein GCM10018781_03690 [Kitasatospora indigofera]